MQAKSVFFCSICEATIKFLHYHAQPQPRKPPALTGPLTNSLPPAHSLPFTPSLSPRYTHTRIHTRMYIHVVIARPKMHNMKARHADMEHPSAEKLLARAKACPKCLCFPGRRPGRRAHLPRKSLEDVNPFRKFKRSNFFSYNLRLPGFCVGGVHVFQDGFRTSSTETHEFGTRETPVPRNSQPPREHA